MQQAQMKPSSMKNEYNALEHFISFLLTPKGVNVNHPELKRKLDNILGLVAMYKKGAQKKITQDRNSKTTRNLQEGLPFSLGEMRMQTTDEKLLKRVRLQV